MTKRLLSIILLTALLCSTVMAADNGKKTSKDKGFGKRDIFSLSAGIYTQDIYYNTGPISNRIGPTFALDYERVMSHYIRIKGRVFGGGISDNANGHVFRHVALGGGVVVLPFGKRFRNLQIYAGFAYINSGNVYTDGLGTPMSTTKHMAAVDWSVKLNFVDKDTWSIGFLYSMQHVFRNGKFENFSASPMLSFSLKF